MLETLREAERYLDGLIDLERRADFDYESLGLARIEALLAAIGEPQKGLACVHVAGSKGKGATTLAGAALLRAAGRRSGSFTSPHLESWRERFQIDGEPVGEATLLAGLRRIRPAVDRLRADPRLRPSFFDVSTALALELFRDAGIEWAAVEVGLGGRLDSTNRVESRVSVITGIQLEHTDKLGSTLSRIAREKAGILRRGVPAVVGPLEPEARRTIEGRARELGIRLRHVPAPEVRATPEGLSFRLADGRPLSVPLLGAHQALNLALAVESVETALERRLDARELDALRGLSLPARIERMGGAILDCSHTPDSVRALRRALDDAWPGRRWTLGLCVSRDKDVDRMLAELAPRVRACVVSAAEPTRSLDPHELAERARAAGIETVHVEPDPLEALRRTRDSARPDELVVLTGSVYFAGAVRAELRRLSSAGEAESGSPAGGDR
ncbi:MAG: bifunctional folylpolyglutamate synthase/dihydrofolate synthase [Proteobacteria bacterium]|nr:bifunctional folylpolyglutamate synthase/dihydrofolate synthase [Pseudomonadota bacterium]